MFDHVAPQVLHSSTKAYRFSFFMPSFSALVDDNGSFRVVVAASERMESLAV
jgi:hypothetical protein